MWSLGHHITLLDSSLKRDDCSSPPEVPSLDPVVLDNTTQSTVILFDEVDNLGSTTKCLEKVAYWDPYQSGFKSKHVIETTFTTLVDDLCQNLNRDSPPVLILLAASTSWQLLVS